MENGNYYYSENVKNCYYEKMNQENLVGNEKKRVEEHEV